MFLFIPFTFWYRGSSLPNFIWHLLEAFTPGRGQIITQPHVTGDAYCGHRCICTRQGMLLLHVHKGDVSGLSKQVTIRDAKLCTHTHQVPWQQRLSADRWVLFNDTFKDKTSKQKKQKPQTKKKSTGKHLSKTRGKSSELCVSFPFLSFVHDCLWMIAWSWRLSDEVSLIFTQSQRLIIFLMGSHLAG